MIQMDLSFIENYKRIRSDMQHRPPYQGAKAVEPVVEETRQWEIKPSISNITRAICQKYRLTPEELVAKNRSMDRVWPRRELFWNIRTKLKWSYPKIAKRFGCNHTTVLHCVRRYNERLAKLQSGLTK